MNNLGFAIKANAMEMSDQAARTRELNLAVTYFTNAIGGDTIFTDAYLNRGHAYIELGKYNKALSDIDRIANQRPRERYLKYYLQGVVYARNGSLQLALESLNESIRLNQESALLFTWRGLVYEAMENPKSAIPDFKRSLELDPSQTILMINISNGHYALEEMAQALYWAQQARDAGEIVDPQYIQLLERQVNL
jgi:tetratricopeptide (TPR) repeat protein